MAGEEDGHVGFQVLPDQVRDEQLRRQHRARRLQPLLLASRRDGEEGLEDVVERQQRIVVEDDGREFVRLDEGLLEAVVDGAPGEAGVVLLAGEALLLGGRDDPAVLHERRRRVVIEGRDAEHGGRHCGSEGPRCDCRPSVRAGRI